jgi:hypothetical protein
VLRIALDPIAIALVFARQQDRRQRSLLRVVSLHLRDGEWH